MVASYDTGDLVRSLVRVPGSGSDRTAGSECLDLARASSLAASVPVPMTLPAALATPKIIRVSPHTSVNEKLESQVGAAVAATATATAAAAGIIAAAAAAAKPDRKRQRPLDSSEAGNSTGESAPVTKRARIVYMTPQQVMSQASRLVSVSTPVGPVLFLPLQAQTQSSPPLALNEASLSQLIQQRNNLRQENQDLQQRLSLFQQLFKDKKRLASVIKRLGVEVP